MASAIARFIPAAAVLGLALVASCNDTTAPRPSVTVAITSLVGPTYAADSAGQPFIQCEVDLSARNGSTQSAGWLDATFSFYAPPDAKAPFAVDTIPAATIRSSWGADSIARIHDQTAAWILTATIPFSLKMRFSYGMSGGPVASSEVLVSCAPPLPSGPPPTITLQDQVDTAPEPGDTLHLNYVATSSVGLWQSLIHVTGPCELRVSFPERAEHTVTRDVAVPLPATCGLGVPVSVTASVFDARLQETFASVTLPVLVDHRPPRLTVGVSTPYNVAARLPNFAGYLFTGDTLTFSVTAIDNRAIHGVYWELLPAGLRDSILGSDSGLSRYVNVPIPAGWSGGIQLRLVAKDALGNVSDTLASRPGAIQVGPTVSPPATVTHIPGGIAALAFDTKRGLIYLLQGSKIAIFSPASLSILGTIALPDSAVALDLSPSGDSIVTALANSRALGIVDLTQGSPTLKTVPLMTLDSSYRLLDMRVASTGRALITAIRVDSSWTRLFSYELATGTLRRRLDAADPGYSANARLERSIDGRVIIVNGSYAAFERYDANSDSFEPAQTARIQDARLSLDSTAAHVAVYGDLYDASLQYVRTVGPALSQYGPDAISPDGLTHYLDLVWQSGNYGIGRSRVSDGSMIDHIAQRILIDFLRVSPDGSTLVVVGSDVSGPLIELIDLSQLH